MKLPFNKKAILFFIAVSFLVFGAGRVYAEINIGGQQHFEQKLSQPGVSKEAFDLQSLYGTFASLNTFILGCSDSLISGKDIEGNNILVENPNSKCPQELRTGVVHGVGNSIAALYSNPPASGIQYLAYVSSNLGFIPSVHAQGGTGFGALSPILPLWRASRNIAYVFFVIVFVAMGLAIMFRVKISPQAVITIQSALPKIIIALLLVTFSYAVAGLMVDLIYVFLFLFIQFLGSPGGQHLIKEPAGVINQYASGGFLGLSGALFAGGLGAWNEILSALYQTPAVRVVGATIGAILGLPGGFLGVTAGAFFGILGSGLAATVIVMILIAIALLYALVRIFLTLLISYISIIFLTIFGPLMIIFDALPVQTGLGAGTWFRNLFANIIIFPITAILIIIGTVLTSSSGFDWVPPMLPQASGRAIQALLGLGILLFIAQIINTIKNAMKVASFERGIEGAMGAPGAVTRLIGTSTDIGKSWTSRLGTRPVRPSPPPAPTP